MLKSDINTYVLILRQYISAVFDFLKHCKSKVTEVILVLDTINCSVADASELADKAGDDMNTLSESKNLTESGKIMLTFQVIMLWFWRWKKCKS